jgi:hypothetical protein
LAGETEVLRRNMPKYHFVHCKFHVLDPGVNTGHHGGEPATKHLSYGTICEFNYVRIVNKIKLSL